MSSLLSLVGYLCVGAFALGFFGLGIFLIVTSVSGRDKPLPQQASRGTVPGRVTAARVTRSTRTHIEVDAIFFPQVEYVYRVAGHSYSGRQVVGKSYNREAIARQALAQWPRGKMVDVSYDLADPQQSSLEEMQTIHKSSVQVWTLVIGIVCLVLGGCVTLFALAAFASGTL